jgi:glycosyltransferase involved in cell wall biosynthesis
MARRRVLFVHTRFPGQFARLARALALSADFEVAALTTAEAAAHGGQQLEGIPVRLFRPHPGGAPGRLLSALEADLGCAVAAAEATERLAADGFSPDIVYAHAGWGAGMFLRDVLPSAAIVKHFEWYYGNTGTDVDFQAHRPRSLAARLLTTSRNLPVLAELAGADAAVVPTAFQADRFPPLLRDRLEVIPDGIDVDWFAPDPAARFALPDGRVLTPADRVLTYVARGADPYRGFRPFLEAAAAVQASDPAVETVVLGDDLVHYGPGAGTDGHKRATLAAVRLDPGRTHFLGRVPLKRYRRLLQVSSVHVHLSVPFVLSWSLLEAMAAGCLVVGSDNPPVSEFLTGGVNGLAVPFGDVPALAEAIREGLAAGPDAGPLRAAARATVVDRWSAREAVAAHLRLIDRLAPG